MENSKEIFSMALGLKEPWSIEKINFNKGASQLDIHLSFTKGHKFKMEDGGSYTAHDTIERKW